MSEPILYSFRRCPYAIRARLAIKAADITCQLREVVLRDKPSSMLELSPKGTVPVLLDGDRVIDESLDVMHWAIRQSTPAYWSEEELRHELVQRNDHEFKSHLDCYKYFDRYPEFSQQVYFERAQVFLNDIEASLEPDQSDFYFIEGRCLSALDAAIFPFVRQFAFVDKPAFDALPFPKLKCWLETLLKSDLFLSVMQKHAQWNSHDQELIYV